jgi:hypothetical protein
VVDGFGSGGTLGGQFGTPRGIAINQTGSGGVAAGTMYVIDSQARVERFSPSGAFERLWGFDVVTGGGTGFEICTVAAECKAGITTPTTGNGGQIGSNVQGVAVNQTTGHVYVTETGNRRVSEFDADGNFVRAWGWDVQIGGIVGFEVCTVAANCKQAAAAGGNGGQFAANLGYPIIDASGNVWVPDPNNRRIQEFSSTGSFIAAYGYNVDALGGGGGLEKCTSTATGACQAGTQGAEPGQFSGANPTKMAFDSSGNVFALDPGNVRTQKFNPTFTSVSNLNPLILAAYTTAAPQQILPTHAGTRLLLVVNNNVSASERQIVEIDLGSEEITDTSLLGSGITTALEGLAENTATGTVYATVNTPLTSRRIIALRSNPLPDPQKTLNPITTKADSTATFSGTVDPQGGLVTCKFQYSTDQATWTDLPEPACDSLSESGGPQVISKNVTGLVPNTHYFVRLAVSRTLVAGSTKFTGTQQFNTDAAPPAVSNVGAIDIQNTSVRLVGTINPRNSDTEYVFNYGTTSGFGSSTAPVVIGNSNSPIVLSQVVHNLTPDTEYFFNLVATNPAGQATSETKTFKTRSTASPLPAERRWEQVSLPNKNFSDADLVDIRVFGIQDGPVRLAPNGEGVIYEAFGNFGEPPGQTIFTGAPYVAKRTNQGWVGGTASPPFCVYDPNSTVPFTYGFAGVNVDENIDYGVLAQPEVNSCSVKPLSPDAPTPATNLYREAISSDPFGLDNFELLAREAFGVTRYSESAALFRGGSADFSHVVYWSVGKQSPDAPAPEANRTRLYDWHDGTVSMISREPVTNEPFPGNTDVAASYGSGFPGGSDGDHAVSDDGKRIFFQFNPNPNLYQGPETQIYVRENDSVTYDITKSECTTACGSPAHPEFEAATKDGSKVVLSTSAKLNDEDTQGGKDLYLYTQSQNPEDAGQLNLTLISKDSEPADGSNGSVVGYYGMSEDGNTIFFVATSQLVPGKPTAAGPKLYRWRWNDGNPTIDYLATFRNEFEETAHWGTETNQQVTPSGNDLVAETTVQLDPIADQDTTLDVYRWDSKEGWSCVSCQLPGVPSNGPSQAAAQAGGLQISNDGTRVPFTTADSLVPTDTNGDNGCPKITTYSLYEGLGRCQDVYEWHDGTVSLISDGLGTTPALLYGISETGRDILFSTRERLVGWDLDENSDLYDARIGGGFPEPSLEPAACEGEACREAVTTPPPVNGAGTAVFEGPGNTGEVVCGKRFRKFSVNGRDVCVKKRTRRHHRRRGRDHRRNRHDARAAR